jgi:hypothetical protein
MAGAQSMRRIAGPATSPGSADLLCFMPVRNEALRLPAVLDHHRRLGVDRFFVVDNGSSDGTLDHLAAQADVHLYAADGSFAESHFGFAWLHPLLDEFGHGHWTLTIDADELFVFPHCEQIGLHEFCSFLDRKGHDAVFAILLDMYSDRSIAGTSYARGEPLPDCCPYFDPGPYTTVKGNDFPAFELRGGPRRRAFWGRLTPFFPPTVSKVPFVKWRKGYRYVNVTHYMRPAPAKLSDVTGALLHFKFLSDFHDRAKREAGRGEHFDGAREYKLYLQGLARDPSLTLHFPGSVRYQDSGQLVARALARTSADFESFVRTLER